jgi:hypothetical protein
MAMMRLLSSVLLGSLLGSLVGYHTFEYRWLWGTLGFLVGGTTAWIVLHAHQIPGALKRAVVPENGWRSTIPVLKRAAFNTLTVLGVIAYLWLTNFGSYHAMSVGDGYINGAGFVMPEEWFTMRSVLIPVVTALGSITAFGLTVEMLGLDDVDDVVAIPFLAIASNPSGLVAFWALIALVTIVVTVIAIVVAFVKVVVAFARVVKYIGLGIYHAPMFTWRCILATPEFVRATGRIVVQAIVLLHTDISTLAFFSAGCGGAVGAYYFGDFTLGVIVGVVIAVADYFLIRRRIIRFE